jgi:hypothetical protein
MAVPNAAPETQAHAGDRQGAGRACQHSDEEGRGAYPHSSERGIRAGEEPGRDTRARAWHIHTHGYYNPGTGKIEWGAPAPPLPKFIPAKTPKPTPKPKATPTPKASPAKAGKVTPAPKATPAS